MIHTEHISPYHTIVVDDEVEADRKLHSAIKTRRERRGWSDYIKAQNATALEDYEARFLQSREERI